MSPLITFAVVTGLLGSALVGGIFFAFSNFVMKALSRMPSSEGIAAMQSINVVVLNPGFLGLFAGTAAIAVLVAAFALRGWDSAAAPFLLAGALLYIVGTFVLTGVGNVPLNDRLAALQPDDPASAKFWLHYLDRWTLLNTLRALAAAAAALMFALGLLQETRP